MSLTSHTRTSFSVWLFVSIVYLAFTAYVIHYALTCMGMFCGLVIILPGLPWSYVGLGILEHYGANESTYMLATVLFAVVNVVISYLIIGGLLRLFRGKHNPESNTDARQTGRILT